ncbi:uncharacterized protein EV420DRAFT_1517334 [Desarmillaria tabescens]|uniref:PHD-type domain-containing protein n=1 Tax=Armillaria tabescens TaxID=1929756 RepID=A0AA39NFD6_ARMTA|nr:uncharacterized protein EV420DRAFT_1517334 [Desarmillaria tabescens]KAK0464635.1 hypothetical protein EV420DRAFT_1517334 [Desarmillaria tabescens]
MPLAAACVHCKGTHNQYSAYLMTCSQCRTSYHHTCHQPPLTQDNLTSILSATFRDIPDLENSLLSWKCGRCTGTKAATSRASTTTTDQRPAKRVASVDVSVEVISISSDSEPEDAPGPSRGARRWSSPIEIIDSSPQKRPHPALPFADSISAVRTRSPVDDPMDIDEEPHIAPVPDVKPDIATTWLRDIFYKDLNDDPWERRKDRLNHRSRKIRVVAKCQRPVDSFYLYTKEWKPKIP